MATPDRSAARRPELIFVWGVTLFFFGIAALIVWGVAS